MCNLDIGDMEHKSAPASLLSALVFELPLSSVRQYPKILKRQFWPQPPKIFFPHVFPFVQLVECQHFSCSNSCSKGLAAQMAQGGDGCQRKQSLCAIGAWNFVSWICFQADTYWKKVEKVSDVLATTSNYSIFSGYVHTTCHICNLIDRTWQHRQYKII